MGGCPLLNESPCRLGVNATGYHLAVESELRLLTLVLRMEVRRFMLSVKHPNHDSKESRNDRHAIQFTVGRKISGGGLTDLAFSRAEASVFCEPR